MLMTSGPQRSHDCTNGCSVSGRLKDSLHPGSLVDPVDEESEMAIMPGLAFGFPLNGCYVQLTYDLLVDVSSWIRQ